MADSAEYEYETDDEGWVTAVHHDAPETPTSKVRTAVRSAAKTATSSKSNMMLALMLVLLIMMKPAVGSTLMFMLILLALIL